jgi:hypothetical protein
MTDESVNRVRTGELALGNITRESCITAESLSSEGTKESVSSFHGWRAFSYFMNGKSVSMVHA